ncbi:hypothetical protein TKK_0003661 [Trichogramma kaykai]|uniref:CHHC U11-48K-type domain-containing protein n=1 Tax=Trichogramma kaykai TaxID=54128 RepID=A0ABD2XN28_9HYME
MNDDTWVTCPYNKAHRALKSRFQIHLTKCRENHKGQGGQKQCPYDANHIVNAVEFEYHLGECESRLSVLHFQSQDQEVKLNVPPATRPLMIVPAQSEEDWETEAAGGSCYQPGENLADLPVFIQPTGLAPAERKNFRRNERSRHQYIENKGNTWKPTDSFVNKKIVQPVHTERKAKLSTSSCESFNSSNPPETPESFEAPAPISAWKPVDESIKNETEISSSKFESPEVEASSSTGTVPPAQPAFSYANAARKAKEAAAADPKAVEQSITFVMRADPKADEPKTVATRADPMVVVDEQPKKVAATNSSSLSWRSVVVESNKKEIESPLNRSASSVESSSSAGTTTQAKSTFNYASAAKKVKEADDTKVDQQPRVIAAKVDEQPKVITTTNSSMSWRSVVVESNKKEMESSLNTSSSSVESSSSAGIETQLKAIVNYANAAKKSKEANPIVEEQPKTCATTNSSSSLPWRSAAVAKKKEIENPSTASVPQPQSTFNYASVAKKEKEAENPSAASAPEPKSTFNYASVAKKEKEADAAAVADEQPKTFARMASTAWRSAAESDKKETESSTSRSTSPVKSAWATVTASQTKSTTLNYANLANKLKATEPKVGGASSDGTTAPPQAKSTLNYANLATKLKGAEPKVGKPTKTFEQMHLQLLKSFAKINFKSNVNKFQFSSTDSNNYY